MGDELILRNVETNRVSASGGVLQIAAGAAAYISSQQCRGCLIKADSAATTIFVNIDGAATATCAKLDTTFVPLPVANLSCISLYAAAAATCYIIWRT